MASELQSCSKETKGVWEKIKKRYRIRVLRIWVRVRDGGRV
jgi:hypothetical protein